MDAITKSFFHAVPATSPDEPQLKSIVLFCSAGLSVTLLFLVCGMDLGFAFF
jgi:hypothetical protein